MDTQKLVLLDSSSQFQKRRADVRACLKANKALILTQLEKMKATEVAVSYCGSGDSGAVEAVNIYRDKKELKVRGQVTMLIKNSSWNETKSDWEETLEEKSIPLDEALREFVTDWLEIEHPGWENNDGASGQCEIDVSKGTFLLGHTNYFTESDYSESDL